MNIIPKPFVISIDNISRYRVDMNSEICHNSSVNEANDLSSFFKRALGYELKSQQTGNIEFIISDDYKSLGEEGYKLIIDSTGIHIQSGYAVGISYGVQTLKQLIVEHIIEDYSEIPYLEIEDKPRFMHRGFMLDCARHFFSLEEVLKIIDTIACFKINVFHWHLTEDQGFRIQIDKYPKLTSIGSHRSHTLGDGIWEGGYYSKSDIAEVVARCKKYHMTIIPEIDMPGHVTAMLAAYPDLSCHGKPLEVSTRFGIDRNILCAGKESTYKFIENLLDEVIEMFPDKYIHLGGDEAPKMNWVECEDCKRTLQENNLETYEQLQGHMTNRIADYLEKKGKRVICWNESLYSGNLRDDIICQYWSDGKKAVTVKKALNSGRTGIISKFSPYYLDYPYAMHSLKAVYEYEPILDGLNDDVDIIGVECPQWTEYIDNMAIFDYRTFPRLVAMAETAWAKDKTKNYEEFEERLTTSLRLLDMYKVRYALLSETNPRLCKKISQMWKFSKHFFKKEHRLMIKESNRAMSEMRQMKKEISRVK